MKEIRGVTPSQTVQEIAAKLKIPDAGGQSAGPPQRSPRTQTDGALSHE
jgi:hypothetical protein